MLASCLHKLLLQLTSNVHRRITSARWSSPSYTNVFRDHHGTTGVVEFETAEDLKRAIRKLDDTEFKNPFDRSYIRIRDDSERGGGGRSRSRSTPRPVRLSALNLLIQMPQLLCFHLCLLACKPHAQSAVSFSHKTCVHCILLLSLQCTCYSILLALT